MSYCCIMDGPAGNGVRAEKVKCAARIMGPRAAISLTQHYVAGAKDLKEAQYQFPLDVAGAVYACNVSVTPPVGKERKLQVRLDELKEAKAMFDAAKKAGKTAALMTRNRPDIFTMGLGNIPARSRIVVDIQYDAALRTFIVDETTVGGGGAGAASGSRVRFVLPAGIFPRYSPSSTDGADDIILEGSASATRTFETATLMSVDKSDPAPAQDKARFEARIEVLMPAPITSLRSPTHDGKKSDFVAKQTSATTAQVTMSRIDLALDADFMLDIGQACVPQPVAVVQWSDRLKEAMGAVTFGLPSASLEDVVDTHFDDAVELWVDCSGSMGGGRIAAARATAVEWISSLSQGQRFNMRKFGNEVASWKTCAVPMNDKTKKEALEWIAALDSDMGGTEVLKLFRAAFASPDGDAPTTTTTPTPSDGAAEDDKDGGDGDVIMETADAAKPSASAVPSAAAQGAKKRRLNTGVPADSKTSGNEVAVARRPRQAIFVTDGDVGNVDEIHREMRDSGWRVHTIAIGSGASADVVEGIARVSRGRSFMVPEGLTNATGDEAKDNLAAQNKSSLAEAVAFINLAMFQPAVYVTGIRASTTTVSSTAAASPSPPSATPTMDDLSRWSASGLKRWPERSGAMYHGEVYTVYVPLKSVARREDVPSHMRLDLGSNVGGRLQSVVIPVTMHPDGEEIHRAAVAGRIQEIDDLLLKKPQNDKVPLSNKDTIESAMLLGDAQCAGVPASVLALISGMAGVPAVLDVSEAKMLQLSLKYNVQCRCTAFVGVDQSGAILSSPGTEEPRTGGATYESMSMGAACAAAACAMPASVAAMRAPTMPRAAAAGAAAMPTRRLAVLEIGSVQLQSATVYRAGGGAVGAAAACLDEFGSAPSPSPKVLTPEEKFAAMSLDEKFGAVLALKAGDGWNALDDVIRWLLPADLKSAIHLHEANAALAPSSSVPGGMKNIMAAWSTVLATRVVRILFRTVFKGLRVRWMRVDALAARAEKSGPDCPELVRTAIFAALPLPA